ncbi:MAG: ABC transporter [Chloroflexi bacterium HGW-Chloroflexi-1]|nr:MAG: ABC transporter [Chloroflexi bacterium HGW-Chloroflexi-1]
MPEPNNILITCDNLVKIYKIAGLEVVALQGLDLTVERGALLGIVGPSGSGKTTLLNILGGLDRPSAGRVTVNGQDLIKLSAAALDRYRCNQVGFVWQQVARNLIPYLSVQENVELPMTVAGIRWGEKRGRAQELLAAVGLSGRRQHRLAELSGGEQQRAAIAVALANRPALLLADEPTGEVDSTTAQTILETFRRLNETLGLTIIIVTHDPRIVGQVDRVVAIRDGKISTETIRQVSQLERAMVGERLVEEGAAEAVTYHEYVVLDSAGRLQVPREYLEQFNIGDRTILEVTDEGILLRPVADRRVAATPLLPGLEEEPPAPRRRGLRGLWPRVRRRRSYDDRPG